MICHQPSSIRCVEVVGLHRHQTLQVANLKTQVSSYGRADNRPKLLRVAREDNIGRLVSQHFDGYKCFGFRSLSRLVDEYMSKVPALHSDTSGERRRYTRRQHDAVSLHTREDWHGEVPIIIDAGVWE